MGPALVHARVIRPYSHSLSDDEAHYRPRAERERDLEKDPVRRLSRLLLDQGLLSEADLTNVSGLGKVAANLLDLVLCADERRRCLVIRRNTASKPGRLTRRAQL